MNMTSIYRILAVAAALLLALVALASCGRRGDVIPPGTIIPAQARDLHAEPSSGAVILAWTMPDENIDGTPVSDLGGFDILRARLPEGTEECDCEYLIAGMVDLESPSGAVVKGRRVVWSDRSSELEYGVRYGYMVRPFNTGGYRGPESNPAKLVFLPAPPAPEGLAASEEDKSVTLTWRETDMPEWGIAGYNVYRTKKQGEHPTRPLNTGPVPDASYTDTGLENGVSYYYSVAALTGSTPPYSEGPISEEVAATPVDRVPPETPEGLRAVPAEGSVLISWLPSMDAGLKGYVLYRKGPGEDTPSPLPGMPVTGITYNDTAVDKGESYEYSVSAVDDAAQPNESPRSEAVVVTIPQE